MDLRIDHPCKRPQKRERIEMHFHSSGTAQACRSFIRASAGVAPRTVDDTLQAGVRRPTEVLEDPRQAQGRGRVLLDPQAGTTSSRRSTSVGLYNKSFFEVPLQDDRLGLRLPIQARGVEEHVLSYFRVGWMGGRGGGGIRPSVHTSNSPPIMGVGVFSLSGYSVPTSQGSGLGLQL